MPVIYTHQRPGPTTPHQSSTKLHPIYQALDSYNYTKALKLTAEGGGGGGGNTKGGGDDSDKWDIVRALRVHALERCGKVRESLVLLWEILVVNVVFDDESDDDGSSDANKPQEIWSELYSRIESLSTIEDVISLGASSMMPLGLENIQLVNATQRLDRKVYVPIALPTKKESNTTSSSQAAAAAVAVASNNNKSSSKSKSKKGSKSKSKKSTGTSSTTAAAAAAAVEQRKLPPITDETTLSTIAVTLRTLQMYDTLSIMYNMAMEYYTNNTNNNSKRNNEEEENVRNILEEGVCIHFKAVCDCSSSVVDDGSGVAVATTTTLDNSTIGNANANNNASTTEGGGESKTTTNNMERIVQCQLLKLETLHKASTYYERMQSCKYIYLLCTSF